MSSEMSSKERVKISLSHQEPDRVPYCEIWVNNRIISSILGREAHAGVGSGTPHYEAIRAAIRGGDEPRRLMTNAIHDHLSFCKTVGIDVAMIRLHHFIVGVYSKAYLGPNGLYEDLTIQERGDRDFLIEHPEGFWSHLSFETAMGSIMQTDDGIAKKGIDEFRRYVEYLESRPVQIRPPFTDALECLRQGVESDLGRELFILGTADTCFPMFLHYSPVFLETMALEPDLVDRYMQVTSAGVLTALRAQIEAGVDGIIGTNDFAFKSGLMFSIKHFNRFLAPYLKQIVDECHRHGIPYVKHLDGNINAVVPILVEEIGVDALHALEPVAGMDIAALKQQYGDRISLWGNLDCGDLLSNGSQTEIEANVKRIIREAAPGGGFGFSSSNAIHVGVPEENFLAMLRVVKDFGRYPISI